MARKVGSIGQLTAVAVMEHTAPRSYSSCGDRRMGALCRSTMRPCATAIFCVIDIALSAIIDDCWGNQLPTAAFHSLQAETIYNPTRPG